MMSEAEEFVRLLAKGATDAAKQLLELSPSLVSESGVIHAACYFGESWVVDFAISQKRDLNKKESLLFEQERHSTLKNVFSAAREVLHKAEVAIAKGRHLFSVPNPEVSALAESNPYYDATPLIVASGEGHLETVRLLVGHGVNVELTDVWGNSALMIAQQRGHNAVFRFLLDHIVCPSSFEHCSATAQEKTKEILTRISSGEAISPKEISEEVRRGLLFLLSSLEGQRIECLKDNADVIAKNSIRVLGKLKKLPEKDLAETLQFLKSRLVMSKEFPLSYTQHLVLWEVVLELANRFGGEQLPETLYDSLEVIISRYAAEGLRQAHARAGMQDVVEHGERLLDKQSAFNLRDPLGRSLSSETSRLPSNLVDAMCSNASGKLSGKLQDALKDGDLSDAELRRILDVVAKGFRRADTPHYGTGSNTSWFDRRNVNFVKSLVCIAVDRQCTGIEGALSALCERASEKVPDCGPVDWVLAKLCAEALVKIPTPEALREIERLVSLVDCKPVRKLLKQVPV